MTRGRPKTRPPDWTEAAYLRDYRKRNPENYRKQQKRAVELAKAKRHAAGIPARGLEVKCLACGLTLEKLKALADGFRFIKRGGTSGICGACQQ